MPMNELLQSNNHIYNQVYWVLARNKIFGEDAHIFCVLKKDEREKVEKNYHMNMNHYLYPKDIQNGQLPSLAKIFCNLPLFSKYLVIYHFLKLKFDMKFKFQKLEFHKKLR